MIAPCDALQQFRSFTSRKSCPCNYPLPTSGDADYSGAQAAVDADGQEIKEDSVVVDDVFGEGITHAIVPLEHADGVTTCAPTGSQRRIHVPPSRQPEVSDPRPESR